MPRCVRNFWIEGLADGAAKVVGFGPKSKDGGFRLTVYIRKEGEPEEAVVLRGTEVKGELYLDIETELTTQPIFGGHRIKVQRDASRLARKLGE